jgi:MFS family permease
LAGDFCSGEFYALSLVFGMVYGGTMPLYAVLARESFGQRVMGTVFGALTMASAVGMSFGPWAGGRICDAFDSYMWLYIGASAVALAAAFAFSPRPQGGQLQVA